MPVNPIVLCLIAIGIITVMNGMIKGVVPHHDAMQVAFLRYTTGAVLAGGIALWRRPGWPSRATLLPNLTRGVLAMVSGTSFFVALGHLPLADAFAIGFVAPLFVPFLALVFLKERPGRIDLVALALGFCGMAVIIFGGRSGAGPISVYGAGLVLISAVTYAATLILLRFLAQKEHVELLVLIQHAVPALLLLPAMVFIWRQVSLAHVAAIAAAACLGVAGHLMMGRAFSRAPASRLVPIEYTALVYAAAIDLIWFGHALSLSTLIGAAAIIIGALLASRIVTLPQR